MGLQLSDVEKNAICHHRGQRYEGWQFDVAIKKFQAAFRQLLRYSSSLP